MTAYGGIDLHGNNRVVAVADVGARALARHGMALDLGKARGT